MAVPPVPHHYRSRSAILTGLGCCALLLFSGCEDLVGNDQYALVWGIAPLLGWLGVGGLFVYLRRSAQLGRWDLLTQPSDPGVVRTVSTVIWAAAAGFLAFAAVNVYHGSMDWSLRLENIGFWLLGSIVGAWLAIVTGLRLAEGRLPSA